MHYQPKLETELTSFGQFTVGPLIGMLGFVSTTLEQLWMLPFDVLLELALGGRLVLARSARVPAATTKKHNTN